MNEFTTPSFCHICFALCIIVQGTVQCDVLVCRVCAQTREELRSALEEEIRAFNVDRDLSSSCIICWNHQEFEVQYASLADEIKIGKARGITPEITENQFFYNTF